MAFRGYGWDLDEIRGLLSLWSDPGVQLELATNSRPWRTYEKVSIKLRDLGFSRTPTQVKNKMKNMRQEYRKLKAMKPEERRCPYYDTLDTILRNRQTRPFPGRTQSTAGVTSSFHDIGVGGSGYYGNSEMPIKIEVDSDDNSEDQGKISSLEII